MKKEKVPYTILIDKKNVVADRFDAQTTPHVFVIDDKGKLRYAGGVDDDETFKKDAKAVKSYVRDALDAVLAGKEPAQATTKPHGCSIKRAGAKSCNLAFWRHDLFQLNGFNEAMEGWGVGGSRWS